jgi:hypothetical protein
VAGVGLSAAGWLPFTALVAGVAQVIRTGMTRQVATLCAKLV